jgi:septal ring factor EnvC (AmiA/AmiB activator)
MQLNLSIEIWTVLIAALSTATILIPIAYHLHRRSVMSLKVEMMRRLPMTLEQIDADREVARAHHMIELRRLQLKIAELEAAETEAKAQVQESLSRIDKLNRRIEVLQIKLSARKVTKEIRKLDEQLIMLDSARDVVDSATIN